MERAVLAYDFSAYARRALGMALQRFPFGAPRVEVLHACDERVFQEGIPHSSIPTVELIEEFIARDIEEIRSSLPSESAAANLEVEVRVVEGRPCEQILKRMEELPEAVLYLGGQGHGGLGERFLGRTAQRVLRKAKCPVYVVKEGSGSCALGDTLLCAVDYATPSRFALREAMRIAGEREQRLAVLHVVDNPYVPYLRLMEVDPEHDTALRELLVEAPEKLTTFIGEVLGTDAVFTSETRFGSISETIAEHARSIAAGLVVVASHGHGALGRVVMGSVAEGLVQKSAVDVLVVRGP